MSGLRGDSLSVTLGGRAILSDVSIDAGPGRLVALLGPNGAGKSTLLRVLAGVQSPTGGSVTLDGDGLSALSRENRARRIGYLPQRPSCAWALSVRQVVALGRLPWRAAPADDAAAIGNALDACDLGVLAARPVSTLSGGEFARAMLARVLAGTPTALLADEPTAGLDPLHGLRVMETLRAQAGGGRTVLVVMHDLSLAERFADEILLLQEGRVAARGPGRNILTASTLRRVYGIEAAIGEIDGVRVILPLTPASTETTG